jgi:drug/metabolite transporter (DMT)-like permease
MNTVDPARADTVTDPRALAAGLVTVALWGSAFVAIRFADRTLAPGSVALGRLLVSLVVLGGAALVRREPLPARRDLAAIAAFGVLFLGVYSITLNAAERRVDAGTAAMLINTGPILIAVLAGVFLKEGFPRWLFAGCAVAFSGCVLIGLAGSRSGPRTNGGIALLVVAAAAYATAVVIQKPVLARVPPLQVTWLGCAAATLVCLPFAPGLIADLRTAGAPAIASMVYLGAGPTALGFATWGYALRRTSAGRLASLAYLIPVVAVLLGWLLLGEAPPLLAVAGGVLCLTGVLIARRKPGQTPGRRRPPAGGGRGRAGPHRARTRPPQPHDQDHGEASCTPRLASAEESGWKCSPVPQLPATLPRPLVHEVRGGLDRFRQPGVPVAGPGRWSDPTRRLVSRWTPDLQALTSLHTPPGLLVGPGFPCPASPGSRSYAAARAVRPGVPSRPPRGGDLDGERGVGGPGLRTVTGHRPAGRQMACAAVRTADARCVGSIGRSSSTVNSSSGFMSRPLIHRIGVTRHRRSSRAISTWRVVIRSRRSVLTPAAASSSRNGG